MRAHAIVLLLVGAGACSREAPRSEVEVGSEPKAEESKPEAAPVEAAPVEAAPVEPAPAPAPEHEPAPSEAAETSASAPANRWAAGAIAAPSRVKPPSKSVLGRLPKAEAIALVMSDEKLELVAVQPSGWRLELAQGALRHVQFEPASGLVFFHRGDSVWAIDLLEPLADDVVAPPVVELARRSKDEPLTPGRVILCVPPASKEQSWPCWPDEPLPTEVALVPEYLAIYWEDDPYATWHVPSSYFAPEEVAVDDEARQVSLEMIGGDWLRARADRRKHFASVRATVHGFHSAEPMAKPPALTGRCVYEDECGTSLPFGASGWEWVVVASEQGDLFHPSFVVHNPATKRWIKWDSLIAGEDAWVTTKELERRVDELGVEVFPLFDGGGRVFAGAASEQLCWFRYDAKTEVATAVTCEKAGGTVVGFLSVRSYLGDWCGYC